uniref:Uncharacterized protein n=1 Tax=Rhodnius prolixus TaxID=13249 RepID=T1HDM8_RHOPR
MKGVHLDSTFIIVSCRILVSYLRVGSD